MPRPPQYAVSDEAAAYVADALVQLAMQFEANHFAQIRRHYQSITHDCDSNTDGQLDLFDEPPPF